MNNGKHTLDLTDFIEPAHIITPAGEFDLPMDISLKQQGRIQRFSDKLGADDTTDDEYEALEDDLWRLAEEILSKAIPRPEKSAREILTKPALFKLIGFLGQGYRSLQESSVPSPSPTPTTEPSSSETSLSQAPY